MGTVAPKSRPTDLGVDGVLVRRPTAADWLGMLPQAPPDADVTVSLTDPAAAIRHAAELTGRGYRPVGTAGCGSGEDGWADFLVPRAVAVADGAWLRALAGPSGRLYEPELGPVRRLLASVLAVHDA